MKKLIFSLLVLLSWRTVYPLPVGNPEEASMVSDGIFWDGGDCIDFCDYFCNPCISWFEVVSLRMGFYGDYVFNRHMKLDNHGGGDLEGTELYTNAGYVAMNFFEIADVFTTLGASHLHLKGNESVFRGPAGRRIEFETETDFSWSIGGRITLVPCGCAAFGLESQYFCFRPNVKRITSGGDVSVYPDADLNLKYYEWQVGLGMSYRIHLLSPYVAIKWSRAKIDFNQRTIDLPNNSTRTLLNLETKKSLGFAAGVSLIDCEMAAVTVEGRFMDEKALYINGQIRF
ncbi:MAG: hypothetical protein KDK55_04125 [Chlamydiia bacterium]|nr:hypothetical protein [Chlamydiia bacterium]